MYIQFLFGAAILFVGFTMGVLIYPRLKNPDGIFRINLSDPEKDVFKLEFLRPLEGIQLCKTLYFIVQDDTSYRDKNNDYNGNVI